MSRRWRIIIATLTTAAARLVPTSIMIVHVVVDVTVQDSTSSCRSLFGCFLLRHWFVQLLVKV